MPGHRLFLLRHAKSSRDDASLPDIERPLSERGRNAAPAIGREMHRLGLIPDLVLCSPARRAQETWALVSAAWPQKPPVLTIDALYDFGDGAALAAEIRAHGGNAPALMIVGHNPALENLARHLAHAGDESLRLALARKYPTGALAVLSFDVPWAGLSWDTGTLTHFIRPKDLT